MDRRRLGPDGPMVSSIGIGAMSFAGFYGDTTEEAAHALLDAALEAGIDHLDTANVYGMGVSEEIVGRYLARYRGKGELPFRIATKAGNVRGSGPNNDPAYLEAELDKSLERLGLDRVDLFYVHRREPSREIEEVAEGLARLVAKGKIGGYGLSEVAPTTLARAAAVHPVAAVQSEYSLQTRVPELGMVQACERLGVAFVAFSPVGRGLLSDTPPTPERCEASAFLRENPRFTPDSLARNIAASEPLRDLAREVGTSTAALAIAWLLARSPGVIAIPGTRTPEHLAELVAGANMTLSPELAAEIDARMPPGWTHGARYSESQARSPEHYA